MKAGCSNDKVGQRVKIKPLEGEDSFLSGLTGTLTQLLDNTPVVM